MTTPLQFREQYFNIGVDYEVDDEVRRVCRVEHASVKLNKYFMMSNDVNSVVAQHYSAVTADGTKKNAWFQAHKEGIRAAAMGKGAPGDYSDALEWAVYAKHIKTPSQQALQDYFDKYMGLDCSGFVTNYLIANGKKPDTYDAKVNTSAASYFVPAKAVNDVSQIRQGDLLVYMNGNHAKTNPGHVMVVESLSAICSPQYPYGNLRVVESTGADAANPKLSDSIYKIDAITPKKGPVPCMILTTTRLGKPNFHVSVIRY